MSATHSTAILSRPQFGDIIPNSNNNYNYNNRLISFEMMYEDSCFSAATYFFLRLGKSDAVNVPVCHRVCDSWWHQGAADWPSLPHAAEVERGVNASPAARRYISVSAGASTRSVCRRHPKPEPHPERWDIYSSRILKTHQRAIPARTPYSLFEQEERGEKSGEMNSVYQHLISLLVVLSSLHVNQLTEGCSCALTHPQDAFCNSDIGE